MRVIVFLHVLTMFSAVAFGYGAMAWLWLSVRTRDLVAVRGLLSVTKHYDKIISLAFIVGIVLGVVAIFVEGFDPLAPWLVIAYVLVAGLILSANLVLSPWLTRVDAAVSGMSGERLEPMPTPFTDRRSIALLLVDVTMLVLVIFDMVVKPFS